MKKNLFQFKKESGQAVIEMVLAIPLIATCLIVFLLFFHVQAQRMWLDYQLYQAVICMARGEGIISCKKKFYNQSKNFLWLGKLTDIHLYKRRSNQWKGAVTWKGVYWNLRLTKNLNLDLLSQPF